MAGDAPWYEAATVVGITNALNVAADGLAAAGMTPLDDAAMGPELTALAAEIRGFYAIGPGGPLPLPFALLARDPGYLGDLWGAVRRAFSDNALTRRHKSALAFAVSLTTRSAFGSRFHLGEMRRLGVAERGIMEIVGVTQMFSSYTKIADTLQLESDMRDIAPVDRTGVPGGPDGR
jgi:alkylhydroperoxidase/carboxymuconolactone decarboxylase family protein YurZ